MNLVQIENEQVIELIDDGGKIDVSNETEAFNFIRMGL
jgi:hypothetical protein